MKLFFYLALLANIIFFLWEFNSAQIAVSTDLNSNESKQILLLSELSEQQKSELQAEVSIKSETHNELVLAAEIVSQIETNTATEESDLKLEEPKGISTNVVIETAKVEEQQQIDLDKLNPEPEKITKASSIEVVVTKDKDEVGAQNNIIKTDTVEVDKQVEGINEDLAAKTNDKKPLPGALEKPSFCYQIGPFVTEQGLEDWLVLNDFAKAPRFKQEHEVLVSYLVYYPPAPSYDQSKKNVQMLKDKGVTDYWLFTKGEDRGVISLGLFKKQSRALRLQQKFIQLGLQVEMMPRYQTELAWFARIERENEISIEAENIPDKQTLSVCPNQ